MIRTDDIRKLSDFRQNATAHLDRLAENGSTEILTVNGEAKGVVMAPKTFDSLAEKAAWFDHLAMLDRGMEDALAGRGKDLRTAISDIKERLKLELGS